MDPVWSPFVQACLESAFDGFVLFFFLVVVVVVVIIRFGQSMIGSCLDS